MKRIFLTTLVGLKSCDMFSRLERGKNRLISFWSEKLVRMCNLTRLLHHLNRKTITDELTETCTMPYYTRCSYQDWSRIKFTAKLPTGCIYCSHKGGREITVNLHRGLHLPLAPSAVTRQVSTVLKDARGGKGHPLQTLKGAAQL